MYIRVIILSLLVLSKGVVYADTLSVYFPFNESALTEYARQHVDSGVYAETIRLSQSLKIIGYTDAVGGDTFNVRLSRQRAANVKAYLIQSGFRKENITLVIGRGEIGATAAERPGGNLADRRVDIVPVGILKTEKLAPQKFFLQPVKKKGDSSKSEERTQRFLKIDIGKLEVGRTLVLNSIYFYPGRHVVREDSYPTLDELYEQLKANGNVRIRVEGHVCCVYAPDALDNDTQLSNLSVSRAEAIRNYLITKGIDASRIEFSGYGRSRPVVPNERSEEDANRNRRVEIRVIE